MTGPIQIRQATAQDIDAIASILNEAAAWLEQAGAPLWRTGELAVDRIASDVSSGLFFLAEISGEPIATVMFQLEDFAFWPDVPAGEAAYLHRLAIHRRHAGAGISTALMDWAAARTRALSLRYLRLDCEASRSRLRAVYEKFGFQHRDDREVGPYLVSRYEYDVGDR